MNGADLRDVLADWLAIPLVQMNVSLATAFVLGTAIGFERQWRQRNAGLRTNVRHRRRRRRRAGERR